jgi:hypothetical protein
MSFDYGDAPLPIRDDVSAAHRRAWRRLAAPGTWWTGEERVAIAAETRNAVLCPLCEERKAAFSPAAVRGEHRSLGRLPGAVIDVVHRLTTDPGRLSKAWFEETRAHGVAEGSYVEILGVVTSVISIDSFHCAVGLLPEPLPEPQPGEPSRYRPPDAVPGPAWVPMLKRARGAEADLWKGPTGNVLRALSLVPDEVRNLADLSAAHYLPAEEFANLRFRRALSRPQMELLAGRVSALNECFY